MSDPQTIKKNSIMHHRFQISANLTCYCLTGSWFVAFLQRMFRLLNWSCVIMLTLYQQRRHFLKPFFFYQTGFKLDVAAESVDRRSCRCCCTPNPIEWGLRVNTWESIQYTQSRVALIGFLSSAPCCAWSCQRLVVEGHMNESHVERQLEEPWL